MSKVNNHRIRGAGPGGRRRRRPRLRVRHWRVRTKLAAVVGIPAMAFAAIAGLQTYASVQQAIDLEQFGRQVRLAGQVTALVHQLQRERDHTAGELATVGVAGDRGTVDPRRVESELAADRREVDKAATD